MSLQQDRSARGLVGSPRLHTHETVLDDVDSTDAVGSADSVQFCQHCGRGHRFPVHLHHVTPLVGEVEVGRLIRRHLRTDRPPPHLRRGLFPWILQRATLVGDVEQVGIHRKWRLDTSFHLYRNPVLFGVGEQALP